MEYKLRNNNHSLIITINNRANYNVEDVYFYHKREKTRYNLLIGTCVTRYASLGGLTVYISSNGIMSGLGAEGRGRGWS